MKDIHDVQNVIMSFHEVGVQVPFAILGNSGNRNPSQVIGQIYANGLGIRMR